MSSRKVDILIQARDQASAQFATVQKAAGAMALTLGTMAAGGALAGVGFGVKLAAESETARVAFETMLGSAEKAKTLIGDLERFAAATPFETPELIDASRKLIAFGVSAEETIPTLRTIGDIAAGIGAPIGEIAELYGKASVQGRLFAEDMNQLTGRGIPITKELAKQFGVAESAIRKLVESGQVNFGHLRNAFIDLTSEGGKFADLMAKQSDTLAGTFSTLKDNVTLSLKDISEAFLQAFNAKEITKSVGEFAGFVRSEMTSMKIAVFGLGQAVLETSAKIAGTMSDLAGLVPGIGGLLKQPLLVAAANAEAMATELDKTIASLGLQLVDEKMAGQQVEDLAKLTIATDEQAKAEEALAKARADSAKAYESLLGKMESQVDQFGLSARMQQINALQGITDLERARLLVLDDELTALENQKKAHEDLEQAAKKTREDLESAAKKTFEETRTPEEIFNVRMKELREQFSNQLIDQDTLDRAIEKAREEMRGGDGDKDKTQDRAPGLAATESRFIRHGSGRNPQSEQVALAKQSNKERREAEKRQEQRDRLALAELRKLNGNPTTITLEA